MSNNHFNIGPKDDLKKLFEQNNMQLSMLNDIIKSVFSPIRDCVKNCTNQLEIISELFVNELQVMKHLNEKDLNIEFIRLDNKLGKKQKNLQEFLSLIENKLYSYRDDLKQTKQALRKIAALYQKQNQHSEYDLQQEDITKKLEKINNQIHLIENAIQQFIERMGQENPVILANMDEEIKRSQLSYNNELVILLERIQSNSKKQLELTESSLKNLELLSTYLQYEDIIGQKIEHVQEIISQISNGLESGNNGAGKEYVPYYNLVPEISTLITSHLSLIQREYHTVIDQVTNNVSYVNDNLQKFSNSAQDTQQDIEQKLTTLNNIYSSLQEFLKMYNSYNYMDNNDSSYEHYFSTILNNTYEVLTGILDISENKAQAENIQSPDKVHDTMITEAKEIMSMIYYSIDEITSKKKETKKDGKNGENELEEALTKFRKLSEKEISEDKIHKSIMYQKSNLSETLGLEMETRIDHINKYQLLDNIIEESKKEFDKYASMRQDRELSGVESEIYDQLKSIYTMDSEREIHQSHLTNDGDQNSNTEKEMNQDQGSIELF